MAAKSNLTNMVLCLTAVCLVCSAILGGVYAVTKNPIEQAAQKAVTESIAVVLPEGGVLSEALSSEAEGVDAYYVSTRESEVLAYAVKSSTMGFGGNLSIMVGVLPDGTVYNTSVLECNETPGLGAKCKTDEKFISQWKGFAGKLAVKKDNGDVDAITASTITSRAYTKAVEQAVNLVLSLKSEDTDAPADETPKTEEE